MKSPPQTAIRGVLSVGLLNSISRVLSYGKHLVITALIGLSAELDAFYIAAAVVSIVVYTFGDVFDSVGVPRLVDARERGNVREYMDLTGSIFTLSLLLSVLLTAGIAVLAPFAGHIAPGYDPRKVALVGSSLYWMVPYCLLYMPYHAIGSFLRANRRFSAFYVGELLIALVTLLVVYRFHEIRFIIPISFSVAYVAAFGYLWFAARGTFRMRGGLRGDAMREVGGMLFRLIPLYAVWQLYAIVDRAFASLLPTGAVSALSYGMMIATIPVSILMLESVFVTPLAEAGDRQGMMRKIVEGILILSLPTAVFASFYSREIVHIAFQRGAFTEQATEITARALRFYAPAIPALFLVPIFLRMLQVIRKVDWMAWVGLSTVAANAFLNYLFLSAGMGTGGIALASMIAYYLMVSGLAVLLANHGISVVTGESITVFLLSLAVSACALGATLLVPYPRETIPGMALSVLVYLGTFGLLLSILPNREVREWRRAIVREVFPSSGKPP